MTFGNFLFSISVRDFTHATAFTDEWTMPVLALNLYDAGNEEALVSFQDIDFNRLVSFKKTDIDTSFGVRFDIQSLRGKQVYVKVNLLESKLPFIIPHYSLYS